MRKLHFAAVLVVACFSAGSVAHSATEEDPSCAVRRISPEEIARWQKETRERFDSKALTEFLKRTVREHPEVKVLDLMKTKVGEEWVVDITRMTNGDWEFTTAIEPTNIFELRCTADKNVTVVLVCRRVDTKRFELATVEELVRVQQ